MNITHITNTLNGPLRRVAVLTVAATAGLGSLALSASADAATSSGTTLVYSAPSPHSAWLGGIFNGTPITMRCWIDSTWTNGTNRWFRIEGLGYNPRTGRPNFFNGYASASTITNQNAVPHC
jgi:hypothetical protein